MCTALCTRDQTIQLIERDIETCFRFCTTLFDQKEFFNLICLKHTPITSSSCPFKLFLPFNKTLFSLYALSSYNMSLSRNQSHR